MYVSRWKLNAGGPKVGVFTKSVCSIFVSLAITTVQFAFLRSPIIPRSQKGKLIVLIFTPLLLNRAAFYTPHTAKMSITALDIEFFFHDNFTNLAIYVSPTYKLRLETIPHANMMTPTDCLLVTGSKLYLMYTNLVCPKRIPHIKHACSSRPCTVTRKLTYWDGTSTPHARLGEFAQAYGLVTHQT